MGADRTPPMPEHRSIHLIAADQIAQAIREVGELNAGANHTARMEANAKRIIDDALARYDGPCSQAYAEVLRAYICAPAGGRDALFLAMTDRVLGVIKPSPSPRSSEPLDGAAPARLRPDLTEWMGRAFARPPRQRRS